MFLEWQTSSFHKKKEILDSRFYFKLPKLAETLVFNLLSNYNRMQNFSNEILYIW